jgi:hypothetical protein
MTALIIGAFFGLLVGNALGTLADSSGDAWKKFGERVYFQSIVLIAVWLADYFTGGK